ncbi:MAG: T9SS type A sorting domain-containing protein [Bacteroidota bacterium]
MIKWYFDENSLSGLNTTHLGTSLAAAKTEIKNEIIAAFNVWDSHISSMTYPDNITFVEGTSGDYTIKISFMDLLSATKLGSTTCIGPDVIGSKSNIEISKNSQIDWHANSYKPEQKRYLQNTLIHEIGHAILGAYASWHHSSNPQSVMWTNFNALDLIENLPEYDKNIAFQVYHWRKFQFFGEQVTDFVYYTDPRIIYSTPAQEIDAPYTVPPPGVLDHMNHGDIKQRSYWDENLLIGSVLEQGSAFRTVVQWDDNFGPHLSSQYQFVTLGDDNGIFATYGTAYKFSFSPAQFVDGTPLVDYFNYQIDNIDIIKNGNADRFYRVDKVIEIVPQVPQGYYFYQWNDGTTDNPKYVTANANKTIFAIYKAQLKSNNGTSFNSNGTHKFIRTTNGTLHMVYNSAGKVWYETSSDNGETWTLRFSDAGGQPAIAAVSSNRVIFVYPYNTTKIKAVCYDVSVPGILSTTTPLGRSIDLPSDLAIAITTAGKIAVTYYNAGDEEITISGYFGLSGSVAANGSVTWGNYRSYQSAYVLANSTARNVALEVRNNAGEGLFHFTFDDTDGNGGRDIYYGPLSRSSTYLSRYVYSPYTNCLSGSSGYLNNTNPSIIALANEATRFNWMSNNGSGSTVSVFKDPGFSTHWFFGNNVTSTSINQASDGYVIGWSNGNTQQYANNSSLTTLGTISSLGAYVQIGNSDLRANMRAMGFNVGSAPYVFNLSVPIGSMLQKSSATNEQSLLGRGITASIKKDIEITADEDTTNLSHPKYHFYRFTYLVNDIVADGTPIKFSEIPEGTDLSDPSTMHKYLLTQPFALNNTSTLTFDVTKLVTHPNGVISALDNDKYINFKVELVSSETHQVIGNLNSILHRKDVDNNSQVTGYTVDCNGIGNKNVQLRISYNSTANAEISLNEKVVDASDVLNKTTSETIHLGFDGATIVTEYGLDQNYPNPFNPSTKIAFALPQNGNVTLKVFDAIGREVAVLVNEYKDAGRYSVDFNASRLSSGIYIYRLQAGDKTMTKRMSLVK